MPEPAAAGGWVSVRYAAVQGCVVNARGPLDLPALRPGGRADAVAEAVTRAVDAGIFTQGAQLPQTSQIARRYGVARTTVRAALDRLTADGVLRHVRGRGYFVRG